MVKSVTMDVAQEIYMLFHIAGIKDGFKLNTKGRISIDMYVEIMNKEKLRMYK